MKRFLLPAAASILISSSAYAAPFYMNPGFDGGASDGDTVTALIRELGMTGTLATSFYEGDPTVVGTRVVDTNIASVMSGYGYNPAPGGTNYTTVAGTTVTHTAVGTPGHRNIDALNTVDPSTEDYEGFTNGQTVPYTTPGFWGLTFDYFLDGVTTATGVNYTSGYFNVFFNSSAGIEQILRLEVTGSNLQAANLDLVGHITYDFNGDGTDDANDLAKNLFIDAASGKTFHELWVAGAGLPAVNWTLDTNVNPPIPTANQLVALAGGNFVRQTTLDSSVNFQAVPEPAALALLGIGLAGLGVISRRKTR